MKTMTKAGTVHWGGVLLLIMLANQAVGAEDPAVTGLAKY
jgi:hypothetical protein